MALSEPEALVGGIPCYSARDKTESHFLVDGWSRLHEIFPESNSSQPTVDLSRVLARPSSIWEAWKQRSEDTPRTIPGPSPNRPHTLRRYARTDDAFPLSVRGANAMAGARPHRAEPGARARPDEGRCRADPHCTHDGSSRHHWNDYRSFIVRHAAPRVRRGGEPPTARRPHHRAVPHVAGRFRHQGHQIHQGDPAGRIDEAGGAAAGSISATGSSTRPGHRPRLGWRSPMPTASPRPTGRASGCTNRATASTARRLRTVPTASC